MARPVCSSCESRLAPGAAFCGACGAPRRGLVVEHVDDLDGAPGGEVEVTAQGRWRSVAVVLVVAAVIGGGAVISGGTDGGPEATPTTTATTTVVPSTSGETAETTVPPTSPTYLVDELGPLLADEEGTVVYGYDAGTSQLVRVNLGTGAMVRRSVPGARGGSDVRLIARTGGVVAIGRWGAAFVADELSPSGELGIRIPGAANGNVIPATADDQLWALEVDDRRVVSAQRMDINGLQVGPEVELPENAFLLGDDGTGGLLLAAPGGRYRVTESAPPQRVAPTTVVAWSARTFVELECDESLRCQLVVVDRISGARRSVGPAPANAVSLDYAELSPDDRFMVRPVPEGVEITDLRDGSAIVHAASIYPSWNATGGPTAMAWSLSGRHLLWLDDQGVMMAWAVGPDGPDTAGPVAVTRENLPRLAAVSVAAASG